MPIILPADLPAAQMLKSENIFVMEPERAMSQDIRPLEILIANLMPNKVETETQLARMLANSPLQVRLTLLRTGSHVSSHTPVEHLGAFYRTLNQVSHKRFDGMIITGAPIELLDYDKVDYWPELLEILDFASEKVYSTIYLCWAAMAALWQRYAIPKKIMAEKLHGVFSHRILRPSNPLVRGMDERFFAPHSRQAYIDKDDIEKISALRILAESDEAGVHIAGSENGREIYVFGHMEYEKETLLNEYRRDQKNHPPLPRHYFIDDDPLKGINYNWRGAGHLFYSNWLNYYVYQQTPYNIGEIGKNQA